jgi:predicted Zn-dependent peptidase
LLGLPSPSFKDRFRFEAFIVNALLGGGMTSKLYQRIREKHGLVYSIYSSLNTFTDTGIISISASTNEKNFKKVVSLILEELEKTVSRKLREADIELFKTQVRGSILLGADDLENRMNSLGVNEMIFGHYRPVTDIVSEIEKVSVSTVKEYVRKKVDLSKLAILIMGPKEIQKDSAWLESLGK